MGYEVFASVSYGIVLSKLSEVLTCDRVQYCEYCDFSRKQVKDLKKLQLRLREVSGEFGSWTFLVVRNWGAGTDAPIGILGKKLDSVDVPTISDQSDFAAQLLDGLKVLYIHSEVIRDAISLESLGVKPQIIVTGGVA